MKLIGMIAVLLTLSACTYTSNMNVGTNFSSEQAAKIVKNKTTDSELVALLGQPQVKTVINETDVKWIYSYTEGSASTQALTMKTTSDFTIHTLDTEESPDDLQINHQIRVEAHLVA